MIMETANSTYHTPVLLNQCIEGLAIKENGTYVDITFGGGGHSKEILHHLSNKGRLIAFDQDADALANVPSDDRVIFIPNNFRFIKNYLKLNKIQGVDGILGDLGVSSFQFDEHSRGFSIRLDSELDMRMNQKGSQTARKIVNTYSVEALTKIFRSYGEIDNAFRLAYIIVEQRLNNEIVSTFQFNEIVKACAPKFDTNKYLAKVYQALRIEVNEEMAALTEFLNQTHQVLNTQGRLVIISYHSLEDRLVKNLIKTGNTEGKLEKDFIYGNEKKYFNNISHKPITASVKEIERNPRSRSAKLRIAEKLEL